MSEDDRIEYYPQTFRIVFTSSSCKRGLSLATWGISGQDHARSKLSCPSATALERSGGFFSNLACDLRKSQSLVNALDHSRAMEKCLIFELSDGIPDARETCDATCL